MKTINFRNLFGVAAVSSASITATTGIFFLLTPNLNNSSNTNIILMVYYLSALSVFTLAGFCSSLVKERYPVVSVLGMTTSLVAFTCAVWFLYQEFYLLSISDNTNIENKMRSTEIMGKVVFFFSSTSFVTGYVSILLTTLRGYSCALNNFIKVTIGLLCLLWASTQTMMLTNGQFLKDIYQFVGSVYLLSMLGGVWIFVLSRMGVAEPKKGEDQMFKSV